MKKQIKKVLSLFLMTGLLTNVFLLPAFVFILQPNKEEITTFEVAEQESVIDEQAMMLPLESVTLTQYHGESLTIDANNISTLKLGIEEDEVVAEEVYSDGWTNASVNVRKEPNLDSEILETFKYNTLVNYTNINDEWVKIKYKDDYAYIKLEYISKEKCESLSPYAELINGLTDDEKYLIYQITYLEAGDQSMEGQRAVIEVILNRVLSDRYPNTVEGVLSQSGQFTTWKNRNLKSHNKEQEEALQLVYENSPILTLDYMMFSMGKFSWARNYIKIGDHWFGTF